MEKKYNTPSKLDNKLRYDDERKNIIFNKKTYSTRRKKFSKKFKAKVV